MSSDAVAAYSARASEYAEQLGHRDALDERDVEFVLSAFTDVEGPILDLGCGPGQWTELLREMGKDVTGMEPSEAFLESARRVYPECRFVRGSVEELPDDGRYSGILAWFSLIHHEPEAARLALQKIAGALQPGGRLVLGFFDGAKRVPFDHAIAQAWYWPVAEVCLDLESAGFEVVRTDARHEQGKKWGVGAVECDKSCQKSISLPFPRKKARNASVAFSFESI
ncbi:class I SAM-dependent methyltransferase [Arthrobacter sp. UM1]|uniref:class I SAM-dependent methyltransferase n=1 Tax=Arthrobacter sp. UM1 TaxID=2766776 RepID=UPI001CF64A99|nr:class I SAM-dependent methyltransferase [Arthrobacter sp. UM1]MCB4208911.1 class I SAM-dependent methyltransferase [Arthrobacter sp. UM1]